jgi:hypothetical protein
VRFGAYDTLENFVVAVALLGCNAMALSGFDFARPYLSLASTQRAEAKGLQLLLDNLTQEQRVQDQAFGFFDVVGSQTASRRGASPPALCANGMHGTYAAILRRGTTHRRDE